MDEKTIRPFGAKVTVDAFPRIFGGASGFEV
jgi:hypothetical protein